MTAPRDWPISPPDRRPPDTPDEVKATIDHIGALIDGALEWVDVLELPTTGALRQALNTAAERVMDLGAGT